MELASLTEISPALQVRVKRLIAQLTRLSEARSGVLGVRAEGFEGTPPPGTGQNHDDPDDWLLEWYLRRLDTPAQDTERYVLALTTECEIRLAKRTHRAPADLRAGSLYAAADTDGRDRRIAEQYLGLSPLEVAVIESQRSGACGEENVRKVRLKAGRDPENGSQLHPDALLKGEDRKRRARELAGEGWGVRQIARHLRVAHPSVARWLDGG
jgi:hypothetical protein